MGMVESKASPEDNKPASNSYREKNNYLMTNLEIHKSWIEEKAEMKQYEEDDD